MALYPFDAAGPGELSIKTGDVIILLEKIDADWIKGRLRGQEGMFPSGFVEIKIELPPADKAPPTTGAGEYNFHVVLCDTRSATHIACPHYLNLSVKCGSCVSSGPACRKSFHCACKTAIVNTRWCSAIHVVANLILCSASQPKRFR